MTASRPPRSPAVDQVESRWPAVPLVLYDADCGFCTTSVRVAQRRVLNARIDATPFQAADLSVHRLSVDKCAEALHCVEPDGRVTVGADAVATVLTASRNPWPIVGRLLRLRGVRGAAGWVYGLVARNRQRLPGATASCEMR